MNERSLLVPTLGNHNSSLFLLSMAMNHPGKYSFLMSKTDHLADKIIQQVCKWLSIELVNREDAANFAWDKVYLHPWNTESHPSFDESQVGQLWIYADGLSNRVIAGDWPNAHGVVFWGDSPPCRPKSLGYDLETMNSPLEAHREMYRFIGAVAGLQSRQDWVNRLEGSLVIGMRYWGAATYSSLNQFHVIETLQRVSALKPDLEVKVKLDSRWALPSDQLRLVKQAFPGRKVSVIDNSNQQKSRLGHLASLDADAFRHIFPTSALFGFDGSLPPTFHSTQKNVEVVVPDLSDILVPSIPVHQVILENLLWHRALVTGTALEAAGEALIDGAAMRGALSWARESRALTHVELEALVQSVTYNLSGNSAQKILIDAKKALERQEERERKQSLRSLVIQRLKGSSLILDIYLQLARILWVRKLMIRWARKIN